MAMSKRTCSIDDCGRAPKARGWCAKHYQRWLRHGDAAGGNRECYMSPDEAFEARVTPAPEGGCLLWTGAPNRDGYGRIRAAGKSMLVHRWAWEQANGPIPEGALIDHACYTPACVNIEHLRLATHTLNMRNRPGATRRSASGVRGVDKRGNRYRAVVTKSGKHLHLGYFDTLEEAEGVAERERARLFGEFAGKG